ncbi:MAG: hypothetical protein ACM3IJ_03150 [Candidatus Levyibacteriota bacterium]
MKNIIEALNNLKTGEHYFSNNGRVIALDISQVLIDEQPRTQVQLSMSRVGVEGERIAIAQQGALGANVRNAVEGLGWEMRNIVKEYARQTFIRENRLYALPEGNTVSAQKRAS